MSRYEVAAYPYVTVFGDIEVPENFKSMGYSNVKDYINDHWSDVVFYNENNLNIDYSHCDYDCFGEEDLC